MIRIAFVFCVIVMLFASYATAQKTGDLKIRFHIRGNMPPARPILIGPGAAFCGGANLVDESLVVHPQNRGIANIIVYVYTGSRGGSKLAEMPPVNKVHTLANNNCRFEPHVLVMQTGDTLNVTNPDPVGHNTNLAFLNNTPANFTIPANQQVSQRVTEAEPAPIHVGCNIHPWMNARLLVLEHPFAAVSDQNGDLIIRDVPVGKNVVFRAYHERGTFKNEIFINRKKDKWKLNRFEVDIKPGLNDLGLVEIPSTEF